MDHPQGSPLPSQAQLIEELAQACYMGGQLADSSLSPFVELAEDEKELHRRKAIAVLRRAGQMGLNPETSFEAPTGKLPAESPTRMLERIKAARGRLADLRACWEKGRPPCWRESPVPGQALADALCRLGEPIFAFDVTQAMLHAFPGNVRLRQLQAWALAQAGSPGAAERILEFLRDDATEDVQDVDTLGFLARVRKDAARLATSPEAKARHLGEAAMLYRTAFRRTRSSYLGINAATMTFLSGDERLAEQLAEETRRACEQERAPVDETEAAWRAATLAEAALLREEPIAEALYQEFARLADSERGALATARRQAAAILAKQGRSELLARLLPLSPVVLFAGHRVDAPDARHPRLPDADAPAVKARIADQLARWNAKVGYASAAGGSDILFLEAMLERDGEIHVVLPFALESFRDVAFRPGQREIWLQRFDDVCAAAASVTLASHQVYGGGTTPYAFASAMRHGLARLKARTLALDLRVLAFWDGQPPDSIGGTGASVQAWTEAGETVTVISPLTPQPPRRAAVDQPPEKQQVMAMLFADIVGYSKLRETDIPLFIEHYMQGIARVVEEFRPAPKHRNTWGDAFYLVFDSARAAGRFALEMQRFGQREGGWRALGLSRELTFRIGLHAGPVFPFVDPVIDKLAFTGANVSRAARIQPVTSEGQIFVSEQFAALAASEGATEFATDYVGLRELPKQAGELRLHLLREAASA